MSARHGSPTWPGGGETPGEESSLAAVRESEALVDLLAARAELGDLADVEDADPLAAALAAWVRTVDAEVEVAMARRPLAPAGRGTPPHGRLVPVVARADRRRGRDPWWALSAATAAVIAMLMVGVGLQDAAQVAPSATVAEAVQSIEATLTASLQAAESGDVAGARVLLEQVRAMVADLPQDERTRWEGAVGRAEQGLRTAEDAVRDGRPVPDLDGRGPGEQGPDERGEGGPAGAGQGEGRQGGATTPAARPSAPGAPAAPAPAPTSTTSPTTPSTGPTAPPVTSSPTATAPTPTTAPTTPDEPGDQGRRPSPSTGPGTTPGVGQGGGQGGGQGRRPSDPSAGPARVP